MNWIEGIKNPDAHQGVGCAVLVLAGPMAFGGTLWASEYALETGRHWVLHGPYYGSLAAAVIGAWLLPRSILWRVISTLVVLPLWFTGIDYCSNLKYKVPPGPLWANACMKDARSLKCGRGSRGATDHCLMERMNLEKHKSETWACVQRLERIRTAHGITAGPRWVNLCLEHAAKLACKSDDCLPEEKRPNSSMSVSASCLEFMKRTGPYRDLKPGEHAYLSRDYEVKL